MFSTCWALETEGNPKTEAVIHHFIITLFLNVLTLNLTGESLEDRLMTAELHICALRRDASSAPPAQQGLRFLKPDLEIGLASLGRPGVYPLFTSPALLFLLIMWSDAHQSSLWGDAGEFKYQWWAQTWGLASSSSPSSSSSDWLWTVAFSGI